MRHHRLYCPELKEGRVELSAEEAHHALTVLRLGEKDPVTLFDGRGGEAEGRIAEVSRRRLSVEVAQLVQRPFELPWRVTLAVALGRQHRQAYMIEKCTELGVAAIWPVLGERSVARPDRDAVAKWSRRAIEAAKQSGRAWVPTVESPMPFAAALERADEFDSVLLARAASGAPPMLEIAGALPAGARVLVFVGPEGGWTEDECRQSGRLGVVSVTLGPTVLRTETAAVAVCAVMAALAPPRKADKPQ